MLPDAPEIAGLEIAASYRACKHVGGDFYDFVTVDPWHLGIVMADVSGHGTAAALVMAASKKTLQMCGRGCLSPRETLLAANELLLKEIPRGMFVSVFYGVLDIRDGGFTFARAGHNPLPILRRGADDVEWHTPPGPVLGVMAPAEIAGQLGEESLQLGVGDIVVLYTDGLTEALNPQHGMWGERALHGAIAGQTGNSAAQVMDNLLTAVDAFRQGTEQNDDEALVVIRPVETESDPVPLQVDGEGPETNLPPHATNLIGRDTEVSELLGLLTDKDASVVTVTGTAGIGKTRVAMGAASLALGAFPAGVWMADLADVDDAEGVCQQVGEALGVDLSSGGPGERIGLALHGRTRTRNGRLLLILDNADQCRAAVAELVSQWHALTPDIIVLATGRAALGLSVERTFSVRPLGVPDRKGTERIEPVSDDDLRRLRALPSVELFVARARERDARFQLTRENADAVGQLCVRLDGIPLAIELAAARAKVLSPRKMLERLKQRFALLKDQRGATSARQSTLRGAIEWSWELLDEHERSTLAQLSVFRGGFFLELAEEVVSLPGDAPMVMDVVESLHDKSLLDSVQLPRLGGERRFTVFESIRAFATEQLHAAGGTAETEKRWRVALTDYAREWHDVSSDEESRLRLQLELDGLAEVARGDDVHACRAALIAGPMLQRLGSPLAARELLANARRVCTDEDLKPRLLIANAMALVHEDPAGAEEILRGVPEESSRYVEAILALGQTYQNRGKGNVLAELLHELEKRDDLTLLQRARICTGLGNASSMMGDANRGLRYYLDALKLAVELDNPTLEGQITGNIGVIHNMKGETEKALGYFNRALELMQANDYHIAESYWLVNLGGIHQVRDELDEAEGKLTRALKIGRENGLLEVTAASLGALSIVESKRKNFDKALDLAAQAIEIDKQTGNLRGRASHLTQMIMVKQEMGLEQEFVEGLHEVIELARQVGDRVMVAERTGDLGVHYAEKAKKGNSRELYEKAVEHLAPSIAELDQLGAGHAFGGRHALAESLFELGRKDEAREALARMLEIEPLNEREVKLMDDARGLKEKLDGDSTAD